MSVQTTAERWQRLNRLLERALDLPVEGRAALIQRECGDDPALCAEGLALVRQLDVTGDMFDRVTQQAVDHETGALEPGYRVGAYRILSLLGRGGMGEVYLAERADGQLEHSVALKLLRSDAPAQGGKDLERFLIERQIRAGLEHPGIARLYDAGITDDGRPYMVMERVQGVPITQWCTERAAPLTQRLRLFLSICDAVAYAHRNLVIHRDLKPRNIFVTDAGQVKLLDFGVAKRLSHLDDGVTHETPVTLPYAAPEQLRSEKMTTATDVYALGVLLFELLCGRLPWSSHRLPVAVAIDKQLHEEPPLPSRVSMAQGSASGVPARQLAGDLDAIVLKALRKNPADRYQSVADLARDVQRHERREPVSAREGAVWYVVSRFLSRYRWPVASAASLLVVLFAGFAGTLWQAREAARERDIARTEAARSDAVRDYLMLMFREAAEEKGEGELTAKQVLERSAAQLMESSAQQSSQRLEVFQALGELYAAVDDYEGAAPIFRHYLATIGPGADPALQAEIRHNLAIAEFRLGNADAARKLLQQAQDFWNADAQRYRASLASSRVIQSQLERDKGDVDGAIRTLEAGLAERIAISGRGHRETAYALNALALAQMNAGQLQDADRTLEEAVQIMTALGKEQSGNALTMISNQAVIAAMLGDHARAEPLFVKAVQLRRQLYGRSAALAALQQNLGRLMVRSGRAAQARPLLEEALVLAREFTGPKSPMTLTIMLSVAEAKVASSDAGASASLREALDAIATQFGDKHVLYARGEQVLARLHLLNGRPAEATRAIDSAERKLLALGKAGAPHLAEIQNLRKQLDASGGGRSAL